MNKRGHLKKTFIFIIMVFTLFSFFTSCNSTGQKHFITWVDADGTLIDSKTITGIYDPTQRELPEDSDQWHYIGWMTYNSGNGVVCAAKRIEKTQVIWKDADGKTLNKSFTIENEPIPSFDLPNNNAKWIYERWEKSTQENQVVFQAIRKPNPEYFSANVFQIVVKDAQETLLCTGSGFVINDEGWFITNNHVMTGGDSAIAFFDIKDKNDGSRYTQLNILGGVYYSEEKDIFIGKLEGYEKIKEYYNDIKFTENYTTGEVAYTIGYPNSSVKMEINSGVVLEEYSNIYDKINGIYYILSDCYIAPGSSGGILINENFEVIGITTIGLYDDENKQIYRAGGSVPTLAFLSRLNNLNEAEIKSLTTIYKTQGE